MTTDTQVSNLVINKLTKEQFEAIETPSDTELWLVEDDNSGGYHPPLLSCMWSDHIINEMSWLRADTFSWQSGDVYKAVYDTLVEEYDNGTLITDEGAPWYLRGPNGFKICTAGNNEQEIENLYNSTGVAWYYILDKANRRFKLPRTKFGFTGLRDNVGNYVPESLPNITGSVDIGGKGGSYWGIVGDDYSGAFLARQVNTPYTYGTYHDADGSYSGLYLNANVSSPAYQDNAPVQQRATQMYLYFYVGNYTQTAIEQTAGLNAELFNDKVDVQEVTSLINNLYYKPGDVFSFKSDSVSFSGYITGAKKVIYGTITTPKSMKNISTITCTALYTDIRTSDGTYTPNSSSMAYNMRADAKATITCSKITDNLFTIVINYSEVLPNVTTNNSPCAFILRGLNSFTFS